MSITVCPGTPTFAAEIGDVDLSKPIADADFEAIKWELKFLTLHLCLYHGWRSRRAASSARASSISRTTLPKSTGFVLCSK